MTLSSNAQAAFDYFLGQPSPAGGDWTPAQAAGIVGNLEAESGINPESVQADGPGRGIAQWSAGGRWQPSLMTGNPSTDLAAQLAYIQTELTGSYAAAGTRLAQASSADQAADVVGYYYEAYKGASPDGSTASGPTRAANAEQVLSAATSGNWTATASTPATDTSIIGDIGSAVGDVLGLNGIESDIVKGGTYLVLLLGGVGLVAAGIYKMANPGVSVSQKILSAGKNAGEVAGAAAAVA